MSRLRIIWDRKSFFLDGKPPPPPKRCPVAVNQTAFLWPRDSACLRRTIRLFSQRQAGRLVGTPHPPRFMCRRPLRALPSRGGTKAAVLMLAGSVWADSGRFGLVCFAWIHFDSVRFGSVRFGSVRFGSVRFGSV